MKLDRVGRVGCHCEFDLRENDEQSVGIRTKELEEGDDPPATWRGAALERDGRSYFIRAQAYTSKGGTQPPKAFGVDGRLPGITQRIAAPRANPNEAKRIL